MLILKIVLILQNFLKYENFAFFVTCDTVKLLMVYLQDITWEILSKYLFKLFGVK